MKTIIIHIGTQKAGSTAIQTFCSLNHNQLLAKGIYYPLIGRCPPHSNKEQRTKNKEQNIIINGDFIREKNYQQKLDNHLAVFDRLDAHTIFLSEEGLTAASPIEDYNLSIYDYLIKKYNVKIVVYLRRSCEYLASFWQECIKNKILLEKLESFVLNHEYGKSLEKIHAIANIIGNENIIVRQFYKAQWLNNNLIDDFLSTLKTTNGDYFLQPKKNINVGMSRLRTEKIAFLNRYLDNHKIKNTYSIKDSSLGDPIDHPPQSIIKSLPDELIKRVSDKFYSKECDIAKNYLEQDELFLSKYPDTYLSKRNVFQSLSPDIETDLVSFITEELNIK